MSFRNSIKDWVSHTEYWCVESAELNPGKYCQIPVIEHALELFLTEYPNGEMHRGKRYPSGYVTSSKAIAQAKKKRGLTLTMEDSDDEMNEDGENEAAQKLFLERT